MTAQASPLQDAKIGQVALTVTDLATAREFYEQNLGLSLVISTESMLFFDCGGTFLMLSLPEANMPFVSGGVVVYFQVGDIERSAALLKEREVELIDEPHLVHRAGETELWMTFFRDPDGHLLAFMSWRRS